MAKLQPASRYFGRKATSERFTRNRILDKVIAKERLRETAGRPPVCPPRSKSLVQLNTRNNLLQDALEAKRLGMGPDAIRGQMALEYNKPLAHSLLGSKGPLTLETLLVRIDEHKETITQRLKEAGRL